jgi:hypothetical protein
MDRRAFRTRGGIGTGDGRLKETFFEKGGSSMKKSKEIAKFLSGLFAADAIGHVWFYASGLLPLKFYPGITVDLSLNTFSIVFSSVLTLILIYYGWLKK